MDEALHANDSFRFLGDFWPDLHQLGRQAEAAAARQPDFAAIRLRGLTEAMVEHLLERIGIPRSSWGTHFERLVLLQSHGLLYNELAAKFHAIRQVGNKAAHNGTVSAEQAECLLADAWSLGNWFCRFMRPDIEWLVPPRRADDSAPGAPVADVSRGTAGTAEVIPFPNERIRRIRDSVAQALAQVDPRVRQLRTRITMREAFGEELTEDQKRCVEALEAFLEDPNRRVFLLKGYAGTGKTFLAKGLTEFLLSQGRSFQLAAPTGRAAKIIAAKTGHGARTLHSLIYNYSDLKEFADDEQTDGSETFKVFAGISPNLQPANTVYLVDEASLLSDVYSESEFFRSGSGYLLEDLLTYVGFDNSENDRKIIFLGDPAQLPPVGMDSSPALDGAYLLERFGLTASEYELKEVVRQKAESSVVRNVMPLREALSKGSFAGLSFEFDSTVVRTPAGEIVPLYVQARTEVGEDAAVVITHSNGEAAEINRAVRERLFPGHDFVKAGDRLIVTANASIDGFGLLANGEFVRVVSAESAVEWRSVTLRRRNSETGKVEKEEVSLTFRDVQLAVAHPDGTESILDAKILDDHLHNTEPGLTASQQRALFVDARKRHGHLGRGEDREALKQALRQDPYFNALRTKFGYAITCHKAQGGEWSRVFVCCPTRQNPRTADYFRWMYTAMTRSSDKLHLANPPEVRIRLAGPNWWAAQDASRSAGAEPSTATGPAPSVDAASPLESLRHGVLSSVRSILADTAIEIEDVAHHRYQEAFFLRRGPDTARVNVFFNGKFRVTSVSSPGMDPFSEELCGLLTPLVGQTPAEVSPPAQGTLAGAPESPSLPFLQEFHERLLPLLDARGIRVTSLKEQQWNQRYSFARGTDTAVVDVYYNSRNTFTKCHPIPPGTGRAPGPLLPEVLEILTSEIVP